MLGSSKVKAVVAVQRQELLYVGIFECLHAVIIAMASKAFLTARLDDCWYLCEPSQTERSEVSQGEPLPFLNVFML